MSIIEKLSQQITADINAEIVSWKANHESMPSTGWASVDNTLITEFTLALPYVTRRVVLGLISASSESHNKELTQVNDPYVSDWEISTDPLTAAREQVTKGVRKIVEQFRFEPADAFTRHQIDRLINAQHQLECRWDINEYGRSRLTVLGGSSFPNTTWIINT